MTREIRPDWDLSPLDSARRGMLVTSRVSTGGTSMPVWKRPRVHERDSTVSTFDLLRYRTDREASHDRDTRDEQTRFQCWSSDSRSPRWQHDTGPGRRRRIGTGPPR